MTSHFESLAEYTKWLAETNSWVEYVYVGKPIKHPKDFFPSVDWFVAYNTNSGELKFTQVPNPYAILHDLDRHLDDAPSAIL